MAKIKGNMRALSSMMMMLLSVVLLAQRFEKQAIVELNDGTKTLYKVSDLSRIYFKEVEVPEVFTVDLVIDLTNEPSDVSVSMPRYKYDKKFGFAFTLDDCPVGAWNKVWARINRKWMDDEFNYHYNMTPSFGFVPDNTLGYTDGCGVEKRFAPGVAVWATYAATGWARMDLGIPLTTTRDLNWKEVPDLLDFGADLYYHNVIMQNQLPTIETIKEGMDRDRGKILAECGRDLKVMVRPDNWDNYLGAGNELDYIEFMTAEVAGSANPGKLIYPDEDKDLHKTILQRTRWSPGEKEWDGATEAHIEKAINNLKSVRDNQKPYLLNYFVHHPYRGTVVLLEQINNTFGKDGDDSVWFCGLDEFFDYTTIRRNSTIQVHQTGTKLTLTIEVPMKSNCFHRDFSLLLEGIDAEKVVSITSNDLVQGLRYGTKNGKLLLNVDLNESLFERAERYTVKYEKSKSEADREDALYFVNQLKPSLRSGYELRLK